MDDDLKINSDALFKDLGTDTTTAIRMFLTQALAVNWCDNPKLQLQDYEKKMY